MKNNCVFCQIIDGHLPASVVYEDADVIALLDLFPITRGHTLVIPKQHFATFREVPTDLKHNILAVVERVENALWHADGVACDGTNLIQNNGKAAGQDVHHVHFHVVPRHADDGFWFKYQALRPTRPELDEVALAIRARLGG
jgi:histidine triad (HIT) family protein